ncbi:MAG TPA: arylesterase [Burkholderiaceae bacterium]|nr:arylesterase [Burkholderiaceae bacterium]
MGMNRRRFGAHCSLWLAAAPLLAALPARGEAQRKVILVVGDSISAEYGLRRDSGWVALLGKKIAQEKPAFEVVNASVSGDTTSGGVSRLPALLELHKPSIVIIELGGNDALRGLPLATTKANIEAMTRAAKAAGAKVLLIGMQVPPNYGARYNEELAALYYDVAKAQGAGLVAFFFKGIADIPIASSLFQADRIHPNEKAQPLLLQNAWAGLAPLLK